MPRPAGVRIVARVQFPLEGQLDTSQERKTSQRRCHKTDQRRDKNPVIPSVEFHWWSFIGGVIGECFEWVVILSDLTLAENWLDSQLNFSVCNRNYANTPAIASRCNNGSRGIHPTEPAPQEMRAA